MRDRTGSLLILLTAALLAAVVCGLGTIHASTRESLLQSALGDAAGFAYVAQAATPEAADALAKVQGVEPLASRTTDIFTDTHRVSGAVTTVGNSTIDWGFLAAGTRPDVHQVALFTATAEALGVGVGDEVQVDGISSPVEVSGILIDPASTSRNGGLLCDPHVGGAATSFVSDVSFVTYPQLSTYMSELQITMRSTQELALDRLANMPVQVDLLQRMRPAMGAVGLLVLGVVITVVLMGREQGRQALLAARVPDRLSWGIQAVAVLASVLPGAVAGVLVAWGVLAVLRSPISGLIGQAWSTIALSPALAIALPVALGMVCVALGELIRAAALVKQRLGHIASFSALRGWALVASLAVGCAMVATGAASQAGLLPLHQSLVLMAPWGFALLAAALPALMTRLTARTLPRATAVLIRHVSVAYNVVAGAALAIAVLVGWYSSFTLHNTEVNRFADAAPQPPGSFAMYEVPDDVAAEAVLKYAQLGGSQTLHLHLPQEGSNGQVRITSPLLSRCFREADVATLDEIEDACWPNEAASPVNTIGLASSGTVAADPRLIHDGSIGILRFTPDGHVEALPNESADPDWRLGGNLPGMVIPADSPLAQTLRLEPSGYSMLVLLDFASLSKTHQAEFRAYVSLVAGGAQVAEGTLNQYYLMQLSTARSVAVTGASIVAALFLLVGGAMSSTHRHTRRVVQDLATSATARRTITIGLFGPTLLAALIAAAMVWVCVRMTAIPLPGPYGVVWTLPFVAVVVSHVGAALFWERRAQRKG